MFDYVFIVQKCAEPVLPVEQFHNCVYYRHRTHYVKLFRCAKIVPGGYGGWRCFSPKSFGPRMIEPCGTVETPAAGHPFVRSFVCSSNRHTTYYSLAPRYPHQPTLHGLAACLLFSLTAISISNRVSELIYLQITFRVWGLYLYGARAHRVIAAENQ